MQPRTIKDVLMAWRRMMKRCWFLGIWMMIKLAIWGNTRKEKNQRLFEGKARSYHEFKLSFQELCIVEVKFLTMAQI